MAWWLERGPEAARLECIAFAVTLAGEMVVEEEPDLAILATTLASAILDKVERV